MRQPLLLLLLLLVHAAAVEVGEDGSRTYGADEPPVTSGEADAMAKVLNSEKMEGMKFGKRTMSPDGKSGRISLEPIDSTPER